MELNEYQTKAMSTCLPTSDNVAYMLTMINEEVGELNGKFSKAIRKGQISIVGNDLFFNIGAEEKAQWMDLVTKELGDIMWGVAGFCHTLGIDLEDVAKKNLLKLSARKANGTIDGKGDGVTKEERK